MNVLREDQTTVKTLSLGERVAIESQAWDRWALQPEVQRSIPSLGGGKIHPGLEISEEMKQKFPHPLSMWVGRPSYLWEYEHLAPMKGKTVLQLAGTATHVIKFILAGASVGFCIDPSIETLKVGRKRAEIYGASDKIYFVHGIAERLPFPDNFFDVVYGGSVLHHTLLDQSAQEIYRVLKPGGRASFHEPLEGYTLAGLARKYLPYPGKGDEGVDYPLTYSVVESYIKRFDAGQYREFELFGVPMTILVRIHKNFRRLEKALQPLDEYLVMRHRSLRRFCKAVGIRVEKKQ
jgi:SAM-dependent methyltransferase